MTILNVSQGLDFGGGSGQHPGILRINTNNSLTEVTTAAFITPSAIEPYSLTTTDVVLLAYTGGIALFNVAIDGAGVITLSANSQIDITTIAGDFAEFSNTTGGIIDNGKSASDATKTKVVMANAATVADHIMVSTDTAGTAGNKTGTAINDGSVQAGRSTVAGSFVSYPSTGAKGSLALTAVANTGDTATVISNAAMGQASTISIPDPGASTGNFLLDVGSANVVTDYQQVVTLKSFLIASVGTWTMTRVAQANYALVHTPADDTSNISFDITPQLRAAASKGFKLASFDLIYSIGVAALDAHSCTLDSVAYANNVAVAVTSVPITGTLAIATQANPYVTNVAVNTPAFLNTADAKYVLELTVNAAATSTYSLYGLNLRFSKTIS